MSISQFGLPYCNLCNWNVRGRIFAQRMRMESHFVQFLAVLTKYIYLSILVFHMPSASLF